MKNWHNINLIKGRLINESLILVAEVYCALASHMH